MTELKQIQEEIEGLDDDSVHLMVENFELDKKVQELEDKVKDLITRVDKLWKQITKKH